MKNKRKLKEYAVQAIIIAVLFFVMMSMLVPLLNLLAKSLSSPEASTGMSSFRIIPKDFSLINYKMVFMHPDLMTAFFNSVKITIIGTALNILMTTSAAYVLTRPNLMFKKTLMIFLIIMMVFDPGLIPEYLVILNLGLMNSQWSVILVSAVNVYYLIIMMRFFDEVPQSITEAATIDGAGHVTLFTKIMLPLTKGGVSTIALFYFVSRWNEYFRSSIYLTSPDKTVLQVILRELVVQGDLIKIIGAGNLMTYSDAAQIDYTALKAATIFVSLIPILFIYPLILKFHTKDVLSGGVKE